MHCFLMAAHKVVAEELSGVAVDNCKQERRRRRYFNLFKMCSSCFYSAKSRQGAEKVSSVFADVNNSNKGKAQMEFLHVWRA